MVHDIFAQHLDLCVEEMVLRRHREDFGDQLLGACVLNFGFVEKVFVVDAFAQRRIEDLLLDLGVNGQRGANFSGESVLLGLVLQLFVLFEPLGDPLSGA